MENSGNYSHDTDDFYCCGYHSGAISLYGRESGGVQQQKPQTGNRSSRGIWKSGYPSDELQLRSLASAETGRKWWYPYLFPDISCRRWNRGCGCSAWRRCTECTGNRKKDGSGIWCRCSGQCRCGRKCGCNRKCRSYIRSDGGSDRSLSRGSRPGHYRTAAGSWK